MAISASTRQAINTDIKKKQAEISKKSLAKLRLEREIEELQSEVIQLDKDLEG